MSKTHKLIAVYGNSGSYKTSTSISIARALSDIDDDADILVIGADSTKPLLPLLFPEYKEKKIVRTSLGRLLASEHFEQDNLINELAVSPNSKISVIGYNINENFNSYATPIDDRIDDLYIMSRQLANYVIVDCTSNVLTDKLTAKALIHADDVIQLVSCDLNGYVFYTSQESLLQGYQYSYATYKRVITLTDKFRPDISGMEAAVTKVIGEIPCSRKLVTAWNEGRAFQSSGDKKYEKAIKAIAQTLVESDTDDDDNYDYGETEEDNSVSN